MMHSTHIMIMGWVFFNTKRDSPTYSDNYSTHTQQQKTTNILSHVHHTPVQKLLQNLTALQSQKSVSDNHIKMITDLIQPSTF